MKYTKEFAEIYFHIDIIEFNIKLHSKEKEEALKLTAWLRAVAAMVFKKLEAVE